jgi:predicted metal-dependent hydrolase
MSSFRLIRSRRKTIALILENDGSLVVRAPLRAPLALIQAFVLSKSGWIQRKRSQLKDSPPKTTLKEYVNGEGFLYLGRLYRLEIIEQFPSFIGRSAANEGFSYKRGHGSVALLLLRDHFYLKKSALPKAQSIFQAWYRQQARQIITERANQHAKKMNVRFTGLRITSARTRWGSCSVRGSINFTWRLVMAPTRVIDYVVIHELVHLTEKNHSRRFWERVKILMPDYKNQVAWLKTNGHKLTL